ncbi:MAG: histidine phosphatase family protein [Variovorax sp.]|nr:MAG: histidine phosphatase family protein [Variovorax sp.]
MAERLRAGQCAVLWRHAQTTQGVGDPPGFRLEQCSTQRNLSDAGRAQARAAGEWFRSRGLAPRAVRTSAWCRCKDTAELAFGTHVPWTPLNSTFGGTGNPVDNRQLLLDGLTRIPAGAFEVWVTHQVNITAFTGESVAMGEAVVVDRAGKVIARGAFSA